MLLKPDAALEAYRLLRARVNSSKVAIKVIPLKFVLASKIMIRFFTKNIMTFSTPFLHPPDFKHILYSKFIVMSFNNFVVQLFQTTITQNGDSQYQMASEGEEVPSVSEDFVTFGPSERDEIHARKVEHEN